jgi:hypothetical protein
MPARFCAGSERCPRIQYVRASRMFPSFRAIAGENSRPTAAVAEIGSERTWSEFDLAGGLTFGDAEVKLVPAQAALSLAPGESFEAILGLKA